MIGNPVRIKKYKQLATDHDRARWLAHTEYTVGKAEFIDEETGAIVSKYYVAVGGIAVQTVHGIFFNDKEVFDTLTRMIKRSGKQMEMMMREGFNDPSPED